MHSPLKLRTGALLVAVAMLMMLFVSLRAQQPPARGAQPATPAPAARAVTSTLRRVGPAGAAFFPCVPIP